MLNMNLMADESDGAYDPWVTSYTTHYTRKYSPSKGWLPTYKEQKIARTILLGKARGSKMRRDKSPADGDTSTLPPIPTGKVCQAFPNFSLLPEVQKGMDQADAIKEKIQLEKERFENEYQSILLAQATKRKDKMNAKKEELKSAPWSVQRMVEEDRRFKETGISIAEELNRVVCRIQGADALAATQLQDTNGNRPTSSEEPKPPMPESGANATDFSNNKVDGYHEDYDPTGYYSCIREARTSNRQLAQKTHVEYHNATSFAFF